MILSLFLLVTITLMLMVLGMVVVQITQSILNGKMATPLMKIELVAQWFLMVTKLLKLQIVMMLLKLLELYLLIQQSQVTLI